MPAPRLEKIKAIFAEAVEKTGAERQAFVRQACGDDAELLAEVEAFLSASEGAGNFLGSPTAEPSSTMGRGARQTFSEGPGAVIGQYKLLQLIGEGGFGSVFMAEQDRPVRRKVALKIIKLGMDTKQVIARFEAERQALAIMDHPNIAKVFEAGATETGRPYFVMELVHGVPITEYCDSQKLPTRQRVELFVQVCHAIQHAHQKGVIHRDIKPNNVLVTMHDDKAVPKVIDFGIAKATAGPLTDKTLFTEFRQFVGTPAYMSPEQAQMNELDVDTRSDIYSLGVLLYELLTGTTPFDPRELRAAAYDEIRRIIREVDPPKPSTRISSLGETLPDVADHRRIEPAQLAHSMKGELDWIVMKAMEKDRTRRYETANGLAQDIQRHLNNEPIVARPPSSAYRFRKLVQRNELAFTAVALIATVLVLGVCVSTWEAVRASRARDAAQTAEWEQARLRADAEHAESNEADQHRRAEAALLESQRNEAEGLVNQADSLRLLGRWSDARNRVDEAYDKFIAAKLSPRVAELDLCDFNLHSSPPLMTYGKGETIFDVAISPDGATALDALGNGTIKQWDLATGRLLKTLTGHRGWVRSVDFSPDGRHAVSGGEDTTLKLWDLTTGRAIRTFYGHTAAVNHVAISPDGQTALSGSDDTKINLWDLTTGAVLRTFEETTAPGNVGEPRKVSGLAFSPQGDTALTCGNFRTITLWNLADGHPIRQFPAGPYVDAVAFSPDGKSFAFTDGYGTLILWDVATGRELKAFTEWRSAVNGRGVAFSPNGHLLAGCGDGKSADVWEVASGKLVRIFCGDSDALSAIKFSVDGRTVLTGSFDGHMRLWDVAAGREATSIAEGEEAWNAVISPDGRLALSGYSPVKLWDVATGHELRAFPSSETNTLQFSPDGRTFLCGGVDSLLKLCDIASGKELRRFNAHTSSVLCAAFSPDGQTAVSGCLDGTLKLWDVSSGRELRTVAAHPGGVACVTFTPESKDVVSGGSDTDKTLKLWEVATGRLVRTFTGHYAQINRVAISPDGTRALSAGNDRTAQVWDLATGSSIVRLDGHVAGLNNAVFSPDGRTAYSSSMDGSVKVWDIAAGRAIYTFNSLSDGLESINITPDGRSILVGESNKGGMKLLDLNRAGAYRAFQPKLKAAQSALQSDPNDASALAVLGEWYALRGVDDWAAKFLEKARAGGATVSNLMLGRCYWNLNRLADAGREFGGAILASKDPQERAYLNLCLDAMDNPAYNHPASSGH